MTSSEILPLGPIVWNGRQPDLTAATPASRNGGVASFEPRAARGHAGRLAASFELMGALLAEADLTDTLNLVVRRAREMAGASLAIMALPGPAANLLSFSVCDGEESEKFLGLTVRRGTSAIGSAYTSGRGMAMHVAAYSPQLGLPPGPILLLPLDTGESIRGVLILSGNNRNGPFESSLKRQLMLFATTSATMIEIAEERRDGQALHNNSL